MPDFRVQDTRSSASSFKTRPRIGTVCRRCSPLVAHRREKNLCGACRARRMRDAGAGALEPLVTWASSVTGALTWRNCAAGNNEGLEMRLEVEDDDGGECKRGTGIVMHGPTRTWRAMTEEITYSGRPCVRRVQLWAPGSPVHR
ncbi:hypothetical protein PENSPDRAFT_655469 [Peniophora sp. CONT]|nr:hypothetical protein PENSPDRAFT_655469 [Peniophora sp. CONT]